MPEKLRRLFSRALTQEHHRLRGMMKYCSEMDPGVNAGCQTG
jgi:hypothetical protein